LLNTFPYRSIGGTEGLVIGDSVVWSGSSRAAELYECSWPSNIGNIAYSERHPVSPKAGNG
jgi:hypothetical protein